MLKKIILISCLSLPLFSIAYADNLKGTFTPVEKYNIESAINILKDARADNINSTNLDEFLLKYDVGIAIKDNAKNLILSNIKVEDIKKFDYGLYQIKQGSSSTGSDHTCASIPREGWKCAYKQNYWCTEHADGSC